MQCMACVLEYWFIGQHVSLSDAFQLYRHTDGCTTRILVLYLVYGSGMDFASSHSKPHISAEPLTQIEDLLLKRLTCVTDFIYCHALPFSAFSFAR